jgi:hypothetical protein
MDHHPGLGDSHAPPRTARENGERDIHEGIIRRIRRHAASVRVERRASKDDGRSIHRAIAADETSALQPKAIALGYPAIRCHVQRGIALQDIWLYFLHAKHIFTGT